jgi:hypothetical protein
LPLTTTPERSRPPLPAPSPARAVLTLLPSEPLATLRALAPDSPLPTLALLLELALLWPRPELEPLALALALLLSALALALELSATAGPIGSANAMAVSTRVECSFEFVLMPTLVPVLVLRCRIAACIRRSSHPGFASRLCTVPWR